jgi:dihydropteroate synthase
MKAHQKHILEWPTGRLDFSSGCLIMGILNVTPDSFSDGGQFLDTEKAVAHGLQMASEGAAIIDIGPESTRPGSQAVSPDAQIRRAIPVIKELSKQITSPLSIDTFNAAVAQAALDHGASIINDITALADDAMAQLVADAEVPVILMHMQGTPATMQKEPMYGDVVKEVKEFLLTRAQKAQDFGIKKERIFIDPGIGFGKTIEHNLLLLKHIDEFVATGYRVLVGASRKRFIGHITGRENPADRVFGTAAITALAAAAGVSIVRVHDVAPTADVIKVTHRILQAENSTA